MATVQVRMHEVTKGKFDSLAHEVNKARAENERFPLTTAELLEEAVNLLIKNKSRLIK